MGNEMVQLLVLAIIALFLVFRLKNLLGTREGFEKSEPKEKEKNTTARKPLEVINGGLDTDIIDHVKSGSPAIDPLKQMKAVEKNFSVSDFLSGVREAYEMILMAFERGDISDVKAFLSQEVDDAFSEVIEQRKADGLEIEASFVGIKELSLVQSEFDASTKDAQITVRFVSEITIAIKDSSGVIVEGSKNDIKQHSDIWTFSRIMGSENPNWKLVATEG